MSTKFQTTLKYQFLKYSSADRGIYFYYSWMPFGEFGNSEWSERENKLLKIGI